MTKLELLNTKKKYIIFEILKWKSGFSKINVLKYNAHKGHSKLKLC